MFLYSLLRSPAKFVLNFISAVIAIAHVLSVSIKSLSVSIMLIEYTQVKYDSTTLPISGFLGPHLFLPLHYLFLLLFLVFFLNNFSTRVFSLGTTPPPPLPDKNILRLCRILKRGWTQERTMALPVYQVYINLTIKSRYKDKLSFVKAIQLV